MTALERKTTVGGVTIKGGDKGEARVRFSTPDGITPDRDWDITGPGAHTEGAQVVVSPFGHRSVWDGAIPAGRATIHRDGTADLTFFLDTPTGQETFRTVKGLGSIAQYSYGFHIREEGELTPAMRAAGARRYLKRLDVIELSPVVEGAGLDTGTLSLKSCGCGGGSTCGCTTKQLHPDAIGALVSETKRRLAAGDKLLADVDRTLARKERHGPVALDMADRATRCLTEGRRYLTDGRIQAPPVPKFFDLADFGGERGGYFTAGDPDAIYVARGLSEAETRRVVAHEVSHYLQAKLSPWSPDSEELACLDEQTVMRRYFQAFPERNQ